MFAEKEELVDSEIYECPGCGANLKYLPEKEALYCEYCKTTISLKGESSTEELDFLANCDKTINNWNISSRIVHCENCGANNVVSKEDMTSNCPFCGSSAVINSDELVGEKPNRVIPFKIGKKDVVDNYQKWLKKRFFAPRKVKKSLPNPLINGVYIPSWTYDTDTLSTYKGRLGKTYTTTVGSGKNRRTVTKIRYFNIRGTHKTAFDDILICSGDKLEQNILDKLAPYNTNDSYLYDERYLVGFSAEHYKLSLKDGWTIAKNKAKRSIEQQILNKYHYDVVDYLKVNTTYDKIRYKYVILPVWICLYKYDKKNYSFMVNGESGKIVGKTPISSIKVTLVVLLIVLLVFLFIFLFMNS